MYIQNHLSQKTKESVAVLILGGGRGTRLYPLTQNRSKPAVPFAGRYRLVDIALSRCIHAGLLQLHVLTQYNSASLHLHINRTYRFETFTKGSIHVLAASQAHQRNDHEQWFLGSADAVRKTLDYYNSKSYKHYLILAGDQIHELDMEAMLSYHLAKDADFTIAATPVHKAQIGKYGLLKRRITGQVDDFIEKPGQEHPALGSFRCHPNQNSPEEFYWGSMGSYLIRAEILPDILKDGFSDFGSDVIPDIIKYYQTMLYPHTSFFEDIGEIESFFDAHIRLAEARLPINFYSPNTSLYTFRSELPPAMFRGGNRVEKSLVVEGSVVGADTQLRSSLIGVRSIIQKGCELYKTYVMGNDYYSQNNIFQADDDETSQLEVGIGQGCQIANAIIDKNCFIGPGSRIGLDSAALQNGDYPAGYTIKDGIVIIPKGTILPAGTVI